MIGALGQPPASPDLTLGFLDATGISSWPGWAWGALAVAGIVLLFEGASATGRAVGRAKKKAAKTAAGLRTPALIGIGALGVAALGYAAGRGTR